MLNSLEEHKTFIMALSKIQNASWVNEEDSRRNRKKDWVKHRWIDEHKRDTKDDHIIFREEDDLYSGQGGIILAGGSVADASEKAGPGM